MGDSGDKAEMPSPDINPGNSIQRVEECLKYMTLQMWPQFCFLYSRLLNFQEIRVKGAGKMLRDDDEFTCAWNKLRASSVDCFLRNLESAQSFDEFIRWMKKLSEIIQDPRCLWNILHTEVQPSLKVTLEQSREIASQFFTPEMLFEFGLDSFLESDLCDFTNIKNEEELVDMFYATAGYMRACNLSDKYEVKANNFIEFVKRLLLVFTTLPDFDAHQFVWLVENIHNHLHLSRDLFKSICEDVLNKYASQDEGHNYLSRLHKMCIISTSPFLQQIPVLKTVINSVFKKVVEEQRKFVHRYIFGCYVNSLWDGEEEKTISEPLAAWRLFIMNLGARIKEKPELPNLLLVDIIDDSLSYFTGYYGEVQPSKGRSVNLRIDIFQIVDTCIQYYPGTIGIETLKKLWFLLYIVAVAGANDDQLNDVKQKDSKSPNSPYLGLEHSDRDFNDYDEALASLSKKFEAEFEAFPNMVEFVRKNY
ncbi:hypothetical protein TRFO_27782 [Tritrichomonas foetus]|uniref:Uncharacterized protein n=1 Tax=Tritrichomonas foetus TaxID=1144522 RepID=A0A1J4K4G6_9EUKA|nr:hypothetical protein TRFO_27782 [Tritrichomonas foetus]|eukprot:OHT04644.1 hypothetical protein TRFO_27782 [Tritrichomonas foetus]